MTWTICSKIKTEVCPNCNTNYEITIEDKKHVDNIIVECKCGRKLKEEKKYE